MAALGEVKAAWGLERWKALDAAMKTRLWNARRAGEDGWTPPDFTPAVTPSPPRDEDSSSGEEEVVESGAVATPDKDDDGLSGMLSSLSVAPAPAPKDVDGLEEALASINLGPQTPQKKPMKGGPAWDSLRRYQRALVLDVEDRMKSPRARTAARPFASVLCSLATGGGKTRVAAAFLERNCRGEAALFVVNRTVLSIQAQDALRDYCAVVEWDRDLSIKPLADDRPTVYVATIQGLRASGALQKPLDGVACVVIDDGDRAGEQRFPVAVVLRAAAARQQEQPARVAERVAAQIFRAPQKHRRRVVEDGAGAGLVRAETTCGDGRLRAQFLDAGVLGSHGLLNFAARGRARPKHAPLHEARRVSTDHEAARSADLRIVLEPSCKAASASALVAERPCQTWRCGKSQRGVVHTG